MTEMEHILTNPRKLGELLKEVIAEFGGEEAVNNAIRKEKASLIDSIFRGAKLAQCHDYRFVRELRDPVGFFDKLYDLDLDTLAAYLKALDKKNIEYMRAQVLSYNRGEQGNGWNHFDMR